MFPSSRVGILNFNPVSSRFSWAFGGTWNTGNVFVHAFSYQKQVAILSMRMEAEKQAVLGSLRLEEVPSPSQCSYPLWLLEPPWKLLVHRCETNYGTYAVTFLLIIGNKTNLGGGGLLKVIVWLSLKKTQLCLKTPQFLKIPRPWEVTLITRLIWFNSLNQKYWLNEKLTHVELQMSFGFRFPEWYNY